MKKGRLLLSVLAILLGAFLFVFGEYDDSPGGQMIGVLLIIAGVDGVMRNRK